MCDLAAVAGEGGQGFSFGEGNGDEEGVALVARSSRVDALMDTEEDWLVEVDGEGDEEGDELLLLLLLLMCCWACAALAEFFIA